MRDGTSLSFGKVLGGSSSINAMLYCRGSARSFDRWSDAGNPGWSYRDVLPFFLKSENQQHGLSAAHGVGGPLDVADPRHRAPFSDAFVEACLENAIPACGDFNRPAAEGAGFFQVAKKHGERVTTARAYLEPARRSPGVHVATQALVSRLILEGTRAVGVEYSSGDSTAKAPSPTWLDLRNRKAST